ncbi:hypothetical protein DRQ50_11510 [bacterium]|nr:MAG: hypothetical protein DRQ50_11510 [bacterium]
MAWTEWVGYGASVLIAASLMMSSVVRLRWLNLAGATVFTVYGVLVQAYPVAVLNALMVGVNLWHLMRMGRREEHFSLLEVGGPGDPLVELLLTDHRQEVARLFPDYDPAGLDTPRATVILRDLAAAGVVVWTLADGTVRIHLDWVRPAFRDLRCARFFLEEMTPVWRGTGARRVVSPAGGQTHHDYLRRVGFRADGNTEFVWELAQDPPGEPG